MTPENAAHVLDLIRDSDETGDPDAVQRLALRTLAVEAGGEPEWLTAWLEGVEFREHEAAKHAAVLADRDAHPFGADELLGMVRRGEVPPYGFTSAEVASLRLVPAQERREAIAAGRVAIEEYRERRLREAPAGSWRALLWDRVPGGCDQGGWDAHVRAFDPNAAQRPALPLLSGWLRGRRVDEDEFRMAMEHAGH